MNLRRDEYASIPLRDGTPNWFAWLVRFASPATMPNLLSIAFDDARTFAYRVRCPSHNTFFNYKLNEIVTMDAAALIGTLPTNGGSLKTLDITGAYQVQDLHALKTRAPRLSSLRVKVRHQVALFELLDFAGSMPSMQQLEVIIDDSAVRADFFSAFRQSTLRRIRVRMRQDLLDSFPFSASLRRFCLYGVALRSLDGIERCKGLTKLDIGCADFETVGL